MMSHYFAVLGESLANLTSSSKLEYLIFLRFDKNKEVRYSWA